MPSDVRAVPAISLRGLRKEFPGGVLAVRRSRPGHRRGRVRDPARPDGSGKSTVLRLIAGFEKPSAGRWNGGDASAPPRPAKRECTCSRTTRCSRTCRCCATSRTACGSRCGRAERRSGRSRAGHGGCRRRPSGPRGAVGRRAAARGARQRAGDRPGVLLLDEPLGALDLKCASRCRSSSSRSSGRPGHGDLVTHDQDEALTMADRVVVFDTGPRRAGRARARGLRATGDGVRGRLRRHVQRARPRPGRPRPAPTAMRPATTAS